MVRRVLSEEIWEQLEATLRSKGCHRWKNEREVLEAILWKLPQVPHGGMFPQNFAPGKRPITDSIVGQSKDCGRNFF